MIQCFATLMPQLLLELLEVLPVRDVRASTRRIQLKASIALPVGVNFVKHTVWKMRELTLFLQQMALVNTAAGGGKCSTPCCVESIKNTSWLDRGVLAEETWSEQERKACVHLGCAEKATCTVCESLSYDSEVQVKIKCEPVSAPWPWFEETWRSFLCWLTGSQVGCSRLSFLTGSQR